MHQFELHCHTRFSDDCGMSPRRIVCTARSRGLDGIAILDHDSVAGGQLAAELSTDDFLVIPSVEVSTDHGDIIGLFARENVSTRDGLEAAKLLKEQGCVVVLPHPYLQVTSYPDELLGIIDAVEIVNPKAACFSRFRRARNKIDGQRRQHNLGAVGGSDAHTYGEIGIVRNQIGSLDPVEVKRCIRSGVVSVSGPERSLRSYYGLVASQLIARVPEGFKQTLWPLPNNIENTGSA